MTDGRPENRILRDSIKEVKDEVLSHEADNTAHGIGTYKQDYVRNPGYAVTGGTSTAYTITLNPAPTTYADGQQFIINPHIDCGAAPTLNINGLGVSTIVKQDGSAISVGDIKANKPLSLVRVGNNFFIRSSGSEFKLTAGDQKFISGVSPKSGLGYSSYTKIYEIKCNLSGTIRVTFSMSDSNGGGSTWVSYGRVYINGFAVGMERSTNQSYVLSWTEDFTVNKNDLIQLYVRTPNSGINVTDFYISAGNLGTITML